MTDQLKWTPGPWRVSTIGLMNDGSLPVSSDQGQIARVSAQADFPRGQGHNSECAERDANAHLIAAAPDLYAALDALIDGRNWTMSTEKFLAARAALAKARGEA